ncbi:MAG TPA: hypothetical protein PLJ59_13265 [Solirubrobacterales bacterium]|nr:hypothetical protein [Solirubrobacterales bacterium]
MADSKGRSLNAKRGGRARSLHDLAAHDPRLLDPSSTKTRKEVPTDPEATEEAGHLIGRQSADAGDDPTASVAETPVVEETPAENTATDLDTGEIVVDEPDLDPEPEAGPAAVQAVRRPPRADFRDALQLMSWTTTQDLWDRYSSLALTLRKQTGVKVKTTQLIRAVVEHNFPDTSTKSGVSKLAGYAERWSTMRARSRHVQKAQNIHLSRRSIEALEVAQVSLLEDRGENVAVGRMVSGLANENFPSVSEAKALLDIS